MNAAERGLLLAPALFDKPFDAVLIGPGRVGLPGTPGVVAEAVRQAGPAAVILDAGAMEVVRARTSLAGGRVLLTPHAGELAHLCGRDQDAILADPVAAARQHAAAWDVTLAIKGAKTVIAAPGGLSCVHEGGNVGLAMSGSGVRSQASSRDSRRGARRSSRRPHGRSRCMRKRVKSWPRGSDRSATWRANSSPRSRR